MNKIRGRTQGWVLENPSRNKQEELVVREAGFVLSDSGEWILPEPSFSPPLWVLRKTRSGHWCKACKSFFRSNKERDPYCGSCRSTMGAKRKQLELIIRSAFDAPEREQMQARQRVEEEVACHEPSCGWQGNQGRDEPPDLGCLLDRLHAWVTAAHLHSMRHSFWNRFPYSPRFTPNLTPEEKDYYFDPRYFEKLLKDLFN